MTSTHTPDIGADTGGKHLERRRYWQTTRFAYKMLLPSLLFMAVFIAFPLIYSVAVAFQGFRYGEPTGEWVGLQNFVDVFTSPTIAPAFYSSIRVTLIFVAAAVIAVVLLSLGVAIVIHRGFAGSNAVKLCLLLPYAIPGVVSAVIWNWIYDPSYGALNGLLVTLGLQSGYRSFTDSSTSALVAIWFAYVWNFIPYSAFLLTAGLATIPDSVYEAARLDRAGSVRTFFKVTLPLLRPVLQMALVLQTIFALVMHFGFVFVITQGGPADSTRTLPWLIFQDTFAFGRFGRGAAMAIVLAAIMTVFIAVYLVMLDPERSARRKLDQAERAERKAAER